MSSRHSNILKAVVIGKKSWGLWVDQWIEGIAECSFTKDEILNEFEIKNIIIPESFLKDFNNRLQKRKYQVMEQALETLMKEREKPGYIFEFPYYNCRMRIKQMK